MGKNAHISIFILLLSNTLIAKNYSIDFFHNKPRGVVRDFYLWQFLGQKDVTKSEANTAHKLIANMNDRMLFRLEHKTSNPIIKFKSYCKRVSTQKLIKMTPRCINIGLNMYEAINLPRKDLLNVINRLKPKYPKKAKLLEIFASNNIYKNAILAKPKEFFEIFNNIGNKYRAKLFDYEWPKNFISKLLYHKEFNETIEHIVTSSKFKYLPRSLLLINPSKLDYNSTFLLAMNALKENRDDLALKFLDIAYTKSRQIVDKNRVMFWKYLISKEVDYLYMLIKSSDINIYTITAFEKLSKWPKNIITKLKAYKKGDKYNIKDPFLWESIKKEVNTLSKRALIDYAKKFKSIKSLPYRVYLLQKSDFTKHYFITPYSKYLKTKDISKKALLYAIAKQESKFIPTAISKSFAIGFMQFMPFVADNMSKVLKLKDFRYTDMFNPHVAILFGSLHLSYLKRHLKHPLFIAYAYNKGVGFTKRMLKGDIFKKGRYEPYLSIELIPDREAREYGKKIITNYIVYSKIFGKFVNISSLLKKTIR